MKELLSKISEVKSEIGTLSKNASNPFFKSKYLDLGEILSNLEPILQKHKLLLLQPVLDNSVFTEIHDLESGEIIKSAIPLPNIQDPQKIGSAITYYRRYSLQSLLALQTDDDDGNKASQPSTPKIDLPRLEVRLNACADVKALETVYKSLTPDEQKAIAKLTTDLKIKLSK